MHLFHARFTQMGKNRGHQLVAALLVAPQGEGCIEDHAIPCFFWISTENHVGNKMTLLLHDQHLPSGCLNGSGNHALVGLWVYLAQFLLGNNSTEHVLHIARFDDCQCIPIFCRSRPNDCLHDFTPSVRRWPSALRCICSSAYAAGHKD